MTFSTRAWYIETELQRDEYILKEILSTSHIKEKITNKQLSTYKPGSNISKKAPKIRTSVDIFSSEEEQKKKIKEND